MIPGPTIEKNISTDRPIEGRRAARAASLADVSFMDRTSFRRNKNTAGPRRR